MSITTTAEGTGVISGSDIGVEVDVGSMVGISVGRMVGVRVEGFVGNSVGVRVGGFVGNSVGVRVGAKTDRNPEDGLFTNTDTGIAVGRRGLKLL